MLCQHSVPLRGRTGGVRDCVMCKLILSTLLVLQCYIEFSGCIFTGNVPALPTCLPNVVGKNCDECKELHWNTTTSKGCQPCNCHPRGSYWDQCSEDSGQCQCKPGYGGLRCNKCIVGQNNASGILNGVLSSNLQCEGIIDSEGNTDTDETDVPPNSRSECLLPEDPNNRLYCPYTCPKCSLNPYSSCTYPSRTQNVQAIRVQCLPGYGLATGQEHAVSVCINKTWVPSLPECQKVCPPLKSVFLEITCFNELTEVDCYKPMVPGIWATYKCRSSHREFPNLASAGIYRRTLVCKNDGQWTNYLPECDPICGVSKGNNTLTPTIVNGTAVKLGQFPWHTGLYKRNSFNKEVWDNICGGTLITHRVVLSAAHCVSGVLTSTADLRVALGKYFRDWAKDEQDTIKRDIVSIKLPSEYKGGATSYTWDIALLLMNASVQFNSFVMPVCMNLESHNHLNNGDSGHVHPADDEGKFPLVFNPLEHGASNKPEEEEEDLYDLYGKMLAKKLKKLPEEERELVMYEIDGVLLKRRQNQLLQQEAISSTMKSTSPSDEFGSSRGALHATSLHDYDTTQSASASTPNDIENGDNLIDSPLHLLTNALRIMKFNESSFT